MRNKKSKSDEVPNERIERPMSWEGELSDSEMKQVRLFYFILFFELLFEL